MFGLSILPAILLLVDVVTAAAIGASRYASNNATAQVMPIVPETRTVQLGHGFPNDYVKKRAPPMKDEDWSFLVNEGKKLLCLTQADNKGAAQYRGKTDTAESSFTDYPKDFEQWGYEKEKDEAMDFKQRKNPPQINDALNFLNIDVKRRAQGGKNIPQQWAHTKDTTHDGTEYKATGAIFSTVINADAGFIVAWSSYGPRYSGARLTPPVTVLPKLKAWHDIAFLMWKGEAAAASDLKYIFRSNIANAESANVIARALKLDVPFSEDKHCPDMSWDKKKEFGMDSDEGKAILASPNGRGAALLLGTHKSTFGEHTTIGKVDVWCWEKDGEYEMNWIFYIDHADLRVTLESLESSDRLLGEYWR